MNKLSQFIIFSFYVFFLISSSSFAVEIENYNFEAGELGWKTNNSKITFSIETTEIKEGTRSARISSTSTSSYGIEQILTDILGSKSYKLSGQIKGTDNLNKAFIRIAWYESTDGSGSQLSTADSIELTGNSDWKQIELTATAPDEAHSAKLRLISVNGTAYFDALTIEEYVLPTQTPSPQPTPTQTQTPSQDYNNIFINEVYPYPRSEEKEWVEIYNDNEFTAYLFDWYIDDLRDGGSSPKVFSASIEAKSYMKIELPTSIFNNDEDFVRLLNNDNEEKDSMSYINGEQGYSFGKVNGSFCLQHPSPSSANKNCFTAEESTEEGSALGATTTGTTSKAYSVNPAPSSSYAPYAIQPQFPHILQNAPEDNSANAIMLEHPAKNNTYLQFISTAYSILAGTSVLLKMFVLR